MPDQVDARRPRTGQPRPVRRRRRRPSRTRAILATAVAAASSLARRRARHGTGVGRRAILRSRRAAPASEGRVVDVAAGTLDQMAAAVRSAAGRAAARPNSAASAAGSWKGWPCGARRALDTPAERQQSMHRAVPRLSGRDPGAEAGVLLGRVRISVTWALWRGNWARGRFAGTVSRAQKLIDHVERADRAHVQDAGVAKTSSRCTDRARRRPARRRSRSSSSRARPREGRGELFPSIARACARWRERRCSRGARAARSACTAQGVDMNIVSPDRVGGPAICRAHQNADHGARGVSEGACARAIGSVPTRRPPGRASLDVGAADEGASRRPTPACRRAVFGRPTGMSPAAPAEQLPPRRLPGRDRAADVGRAPATGELTRRVAPSRRQRCCVRR